MTQNPTQPARLQWISNHLHLQGFSAELQTTAATLSLGAPPRLYFGIMRGTVQRSGTTAQVSGDVDDGDLTLEESISGTNISATWTGRVVDGSCGNGNTRIMDSKHLSRHTPALRPRASRPVGNERCPPRHGPAHGLAQAVSLLAHPGHGPNHAWQRSRPRPQPGCSLAPLLPCRRQRGTPGLL